MIFKIIKRNFVYGIFWEQRDFFVYRNAAKYAKALKI